MNWWIVFKWSMTVAMIIGVIAMACYWGFMGIIYGFVLYVLWSAMMPEEE